MDEHPIDHPFVESDEVMSDDAEVATRRRWPIVVVSVVIVVVAIGAAFYVGGESLPAALPKPRRRLRLRGPDVERRVGGESRVGRRPAGRGLDRAHRVVPRRGGLHDLERPTLSRHHREGHAAGHPLGLVGRARVLRLKPGAPGAYGYKGGPSFTPTTLASKGQLELVIHWNEECVPTSADSGIETYRGVNVEYSFVGFHHTVSVPIQNLNIGPRSTC